ncbi:hypothetical protein LSO07_17630 [Janthinobacterium sp. PLB04]|uniref:hypothetical protein n=1 Tax=Janthinobacterium TaxID=29580 RepID=UPI001247E29B|nr:MULTISPECIES: hypothetical protein [Janthinobacterium]KAB0331026.1 hypothetical protein F3B38_04580 [Janthinobacterium lividum]UGQ34332.1 hypothetical protein LSO07_17630 [Janthinobacterium sp. PLB04]
MQGDIPDEKYRTKKTRKVIQIAPVQRPIIDQVYRVESVDVQVFALCDDGTMWSRRTGQDVWLEIQNVPQP